MSLSTGKLIARRLINGIVRALTYLTCEVDAHELKRVPVVGPAILIVNHINFLELPILYPRIPSDLGVGFSKKENWDNPIYRLLFTNWNILPIERDTADISAIRSGLQVLQEGKILFITPEGTRSHDGRLQRGKAGVVLIAIRSQVPVWPIACYGGEKFMENLKRLRRTPYHVRVGNPFRVNTHGVKVTRQVRQQIVDEMMYQLAALMPPPYRGVYSDLEHATETYLEFEHPGDSNLLRARQVTTRESQSQRR